MIFRALWRKRAILPAALALAVSGAAHAAPPPPAVYDGPSEVDGYQADTLFQRWIMWVEGGKGAAIDAVLALPRDLGDVRATGPIAVIRGSSEYGHAYTAEVQAYCPRSRVQPGPARPASDPACYYELREATITQDAGRAAGTSQLADWARANFDASALVAQLKAQGVTTDDDLWLTSMDTAFEAAPSPDAILRQGVVIQVTDSRRCPEMGRAIERLEGRTLSLPIDLPSVGQDAYWAPPPPHGVYLQYRLTLLSSEGSPINIEGGSPLAQWVEPIRRAAVGCPRSVEDRASGE